MMNPVKLVISNPVHLTSLEQTPFLCQLAIELHANALEYILHPSYENLVQSVTLHPSSLRFIKNQTPELCTIALSGNGMALEYVQEPIPEMYKIAITHSPHALKYVPVAEQTAELCQLACKNPAALKYVSPRLDKFIYEMVSKHPMAIKYVQHQTEELCTLAVSKDPQAITGIREPSADVCLIALMKLPHLIKKIPNPPPEVWKPVLAYDPAVIVHMNQTLAMCEYLFDLYPYSLKLLKYKTDAMLHKAIEYDPLLILAMENPAPDLCAKAVKAHPALVFKLNPTAVIYHELVNNSAFIPCIKNDSIRQEAIKIRDNRFSQTKRA